MSLTGQIKTKRDCRQSWIKWNGLLSFLNNRNSDFEPGLETTQEFMNLFELPKLGKK